MATDTVAKLIALAAAVVGTSAAVFYWLRAALAQRAVRRRFARGARGQARASTLLQGWGFEIVAAEPAFSGVVEVDGVEAEISARPDFLVRRRGELAVVEVKTGDKVTDPLHRATRRQLREYAALAEVDALYLLDAEQGRMARVRFPERGLGRGRARCGLCFALGSAVGLALAALSAWLSGS